MFIQMIEERVLLSSIHGVMRVTFVIFKAFLEQTA